MKTILLVDDDKEVLTAFGMALRNHGYHVLETDCGAAALEMARQYLPDLILSDIHMPGGDGSTLLRDIRSNPELKSTQVVLMTGKPELVTPRRGMEEGADDFLVKPVSREALLNCLEARFRRASINWRVEEHMLAQLRASVPSNLPHEFFTPLAGIIGLMEILRSDFPRLPPAEVSDIHKDVYDSALRLHRTLRNYLMILNLHGNPSEAAPSPLSPHDVEDKIRYGIEEAMRLNARREDTTIRIAPCSLAVNPEDLSHMVEELVDNACKFSRQGTPVTVELSAEGQLTVRDEGRGLTAEMIERIGAFQQFDRKKNEQQGLGLGLVLVRKLAAQCQAKFSMTSESGKGTQARIDFPPASPA